jgi:phosphate uptake regulator
MRRKIIKQGLGGYTIYLPKKWVNKLGLNEGNELVVEEKDNRLIIEAERVIEEKIVYVILKKGNHKHIFLQELIGLYEVGYNEIHIKFDYEKILNPERNKEEVIIDVIESFLPSLIGFEIVKLRSNLIVLKDIAEPKKGEFDVVFQRIFYNLFNFKDLISEFLEGNGSSKDFAAQHKTIRKFISFCLRILASTDKTEYEKIQYASILHTLDNINDSHLALGYVFPDELNKEEIKILKLIGELIYQYKAAFYSKKDSDIEKVFELYLSINKILKNPKNLNDAIVGFAQINKLTESMIKPLMVLHKIKGLK